MQLLKLGILRVIAYFDVFDYPVTINEIKLFIDKPFTESELSFALQQLQQYNAVYRFNKFYSLRNEYTLVERRIKGNMLAEKKLKQAKKISKFLFCFPFIKGIAISGSLSKHFAYKGSDMDFFIITAANRLWIARIIFMGFYKIATVVGAKNLFCLNYFIDETALEIPEKNIYTATEIATLIPVRGQHLFTEFYIKNKWVHNYLPNCDLSEGDYAERKGVYIKRFIQWLLNGSIGERLDNYIIKFYARRWKRKMQQKRYAKNGFLFGSYIVEKHICKPVPQYFQGKILKKFEERLKAVEGTSYTEELMAV